MIGLVLVLVFSTITGMLSIRYRIPHVAVLLAGGILIGPNVLGLVDNTSINFFAEIGAILLLFNVGVEFNISRLFSTGLRTIAGAMLLIVILFITMYEAALVIGFNTMTSLFIAAMFCMSSTAIIAKLLEQYHLIKRKEVPFLMAILIIEDIAAVFFLTFFSNIHSGAYNGGNILASFVLAVMVLAFSYILIKRILSQFLFSFSRFYNHDTLILFSFTFGILMSILASFIGLNSAIGAFLAGSLLSSIPKGRVLTRSMKPFSLIFSSFFFLSIGMLVSPSTIITNIDTTMLLVAFFMVSVFFATGFVFFLISANGNSSVFAALAMLPLGEFSLLIAKEGTGVVGTDLIGIAFIGVLITSFVASILINRSEKVYASMRITIPATIVNTFHAASLYFTNVIHAFEPKGYLHNLCRKEIPKIANYFSFLLGIVFIFLGIKPYLGFSFYAFGAHINAMLVGLVILTALTIVPAVKIISAIRKVIDGLATVFSHTTPQADRMALLRNAAVSFVFFLLSMNTSTIVDYFSLPQFFSLTSLVFVVFSVFFIWSALRVLSFGFFIRGVKPVRLFNNNPVSSDGDMVVVGAKKSTPAKGKLHRVKKKTQKET
jgi:Kef-type K+ transport system membrane component KefB